MSLARRVAPLVAALALAGAAAAGPRARPAGATTAPTHVAIVVAGAGSACVPWHGGMTGADVLSANFSVTYGQRPPYVGFVLLINGAGTTTPDLTHYWAYYHNSGGGWAYSGSGASTFHPQPGTVEGWAYDNGQSPAPSPPSQSYAAICAGQDPAPAPAPSRPYLTPPAATHHGASTPAPVRVTGSRIPAAAASPATTPPAHGHRATPSPASSTTGAGPAGGAGASTPVDPGPAVRLVDAAPTASHPSAAPAWGTALALLAAVSIGGAALWRLRRQRQG